MAALTITQRRPARAIVPPAKRARPRTEKGLEFEFPYAPRGTSLGGLAAPVTVQARPGRKPLSLLDGGNLASLDLVFQLAHFDHQLPVEAMVNELRRIGGLLKHIHNQSGGAYSRDTAAALVEITAAIKRIGE